jgi:MoxR-like ATPase
MPFLRFAAIDPQPPFPPHGEPNPPGPGSSAQVLQRDVPRFLNDLHDAAPWYRPSPELIDAVNVALAVGAPLLVTGEPGSGKTQLAYHLAWYFNLKPEPDNAGRATNGDRRQPFVFHTRSTSVAHELLYRFDTVQYFHDAREHGPTPDKQTYVYRGPLWRAFDRLHAKEAAIVLIDEIDKAPRDFPNDLLHELSQYKLDVTETGKTITRPNEADPPLVIVTSNEERRLPDAFLRRCVYHHIEVTPELLSTAAIAHLGRLLGHDRDQPDELPAEARALATAAVQVVKALREDRNLSKRPATAELLAWLTALVRAGKGAPALDVRRAELPFLGVLLKDHVDLRGARPGG